MILRCAAPVGETRLAHCLGRSDAALLSIPCRPVRAAAPPSRAPAAPRAAGNCCRESTLSAPPLLRLRRGGAALPRWTRAADGPGDGPLRNHADEKIGEPVDSSTNCEQLPVSEERISFNGRPTPDRSPPERKHGDSERPGFQLDGNWDGASSTQKFGSSGAESFRRDEQGHPVLTIPGPASRSLDREMDVAVRAVQLACVLSQRTQQRLLHREEKADQKQDRSLVTVADWGVQAVVTWTLSQGGQEAIPMIAEEDTAGLRGMEKMDQLGNVVDAVNECLREASVVGLSPPRRPLSSEDVLQYIGRGGAQGGRMGRYWVLDPVDGTLGFVRGDQYAIALALIDQGEVVLAVLGCPNFPLRKQWLRYHHRFYRLASKLIPPSPGKWHKGMILTTFKGAGQVLMRPLVVDPEGVPQVELVGQMPRPISVSPIDDPAKATFCEPFEKSNTSHSFTAGLAESIGLRNRPLRVYSLAKYAAIARGDAEIFMKFAKAGYKEKIWDHAAGVLIVQEAGGVVTDAAGYPLDFSRGRFLEDLDRGIVACSGKTLHERLIGAVDASWNSSTL